MKGRLKRILSMLFAILIIASSTNIVGAVGFTSATYSKIKDSIRAAEGIKNELGLSSVNFEDFTVGDPIYVYNYENEALVKSREFYPLFIDNALTAFAIESTLDNNTQYQFSTTYVEEINSLGIEDDTPFAIIYDCSSTYLYYNGIATIIGTAGDIIPERGNLTQCNPSVFSDIHLQNMQKKNALGYVYSSLNSRARISCDVDYISQGSYNICWAACIASIVNYLSGTDLDAVDVAVMYYGSNWNQGLSPYTEDDILRQAYGLSYYCVNVPSTQSAAFNLFKYNIQRNRPIYANFLYLSSGHASVIYGVEDAAGYVYIMEPNTGFWTLQYSSSLGYYFILPSNNRTYSLDYLTCTYTSS